MSDHKVGNRDAKIMRENEGKSPYELLQLGLSKAAYERLLTAQVEPAKVEPAKAVVEAEPTPTVIETKPGTTEPITTTEVKLTPDTVEHIDRKKAAQPRLGRTAAQVSKVANAKPKQVRVLGPTGIPQLISESQALKMVARNPNIYKII